MESIFIDLGDIYGDLSSPQVQIAKCMNENYANTWEDTLFISSLLSCWLQQRQSDISAFYSGIQHIQHIKRGWGRHVTGSFVSS